jgi:hypothetical protein
MVTPFDLSNRTHAGLPANSDASNRATATSHWTASTALARSAMTLLPAVLTMRRDQSIDDGTASLPPGERADLVACHQTAVNGDVSGKGRGEFALYRMDRHARLLLNQV